MQALIAGSRVRFRTVAGVALALGVGAVVLWVSVALPITPEPAPELAPPEISSTTTPTPGTVAKPTPSDEIQPDLSPTSSPDPEIGIDVGQLAPDFELRTPEGEAVRLSDLRGKPIWLNFWAPWCPSCLTEMPRLEGFYLANHGRGLVVMGVGVRDSPESMRAYADQLGVTYPIVADGDGIVADQYRAVALPVHYWIDVDGFVRDWAYGELPPDALSISLEAILPAQPASIP